jgi:hypothetical protein
VHNAIHQKNVNVDPAKGLAPPRPPQPFAIDGDVTTAADHTAAQPPSRRWFPTYRTVRRVYEEHLASLNLHPDDIQAIAQLVGDMKTDGVLLHHQDQKCGCATGRARKPKTTPSTLAGVRDATLDMYCSGGESCTPFELIWMEPWQK